MGELGASCVHFLTEETRDIEKPAWDEERFGQVCTSAETFSDIEAALRKLCSTATAHCSYEVKQALRQAEAQMTDFKAKLNEISLTAK